MKATKAYIENKFEEFNQQIFAGKLPPITICLSDAKTFLGRITYKKRIGNDGKPDFYDFKMRINTRIDLSEQEIEDTIIHEMIHYYIVIKHLDDTSSHGPMFIHIMNEVNRKYNRQISISFKGNEDQKKQMENTKPKYHVIAVLSFKDGRKGIKVLPRVLPTVLNYYKRMSEDNNVLSIDLYMSNSIYFNRYPNSGALTAHFLEETIINRNLRNAEHIQCDGKRIIRSKK